MRPVGAATVGRWCFGEDPGRLRGALARGAVLAIPTESSYGLAVDPRDAAAVARIFLLKGRSDGKALPVVGARPSSFAVLGVEASDPALAWAAHRWPAALSVLVALAQPIPASVGRPSLAVRVPAHEGLRGLLAALDQPLTATSANASGAPAWVDVDDLAEWLAAVCERDGIEGWIVDGGRLPGGPPSTLVELVDGRPVVLRPGRFHLD